MLLLYLLLHSVLYGWLVVAILNHGMDVYAVALSVEHRSTNRTAACHVALFGFHLNSLSLFSF